ncbi:hypothetical protein LTR50_003718 [Elasticomyces elasticus]|nr:hypothetical protein LTR50_003718 [Elasticomyces elasticus]
MPPKRMTANRDRSHRYFPGKVEYAQDALSSDSENSDAEVSSAHQPAKPTLPKATSFPKDARLAANLSKINLDARRAQAAAQEAERLKREAEARAKEEEGFVTDDDNDEDDGSGREQESGSEEEEQEESTSSEDDVPKRRMPAPKFISKTNRKQHSVPVFSEEELAAQEDARRKERADEMLQLQLEKQAAAKAAGKKDWDDDEEGLADEVDDTDDIDPEEERALWKKRELLRIKRDRDAIESAEKEREEIERRRNLSKEEREAEDREYIDTQKEEHEGKGKMGHMQKYFHRGAYTFDADDETKQLLNRDIMGSRFQDDARDKSMLPSALQIRDMTKIGKKGRTRYRDMKSEDTGRWGDLGVRDRRKDGDHRLDERFLSDGDAERPGGTGANAYAVGERRKRVDDSREGRRDDKRPKYDR